METASKKKTLTIKEAAEVLGIGRGLAYRMAESGSIPTLRLGRKLLVPRQALTQLLGAPTAKSAESKEPAGV